MKDVIKVEDGFKITFNNGGAYDIASGENGATLKVKIKEGYWYIGNVRQITAADPQGSAGPAGPNGSKGLKDVSSKSSYVGADGLWHFYQLGHENAIKEGDRAEWT